MTPQPTPLDLDALELAAKAATPGPWTARYEPTGTHGGGDEWHIDGPAPYGCVSCGLSDGSNGERNPNADLIALANPAAAEVLDHQAKLARLYNAMCGAMAWLAADADNRSDTEVADIADIRADMHSVFHASPGVLYQGGPGVSEANVRIAALRALVKP
jgi:hypothetical protein